MTTPTHHLTPSSRWSLRYIGNISGSNPFQIVSPSAQAAYFQLMNLESGDIASFAYIGGGISAGFNITNANFLPDWVSFETTIPYTFEDFAGHANMGNLTIGVPGFNNSLINLLQFNNIDIKDSMLNSVDLSGPGVGTVLGAQASMNTGIVQLVGIQHTDGDLTTLQESGSDLSGLTPPWMDFPLSIDPFQSTSPHVSSTQDVPDWLIDAGNQLITNTLPNHDPGQSTWSPHDPGSNVALPTSDDSGLASATSHLTNPFSIDGNSFINPDGLATGSESSLVNIDLTNLQGLTNLPIDQVLYHLADGHCIDPSVVAHDNGSNADTQAILTHAINSHAHDPAVYEPHDNVCIDPGAVDHHN